MAPEAMTENGGGVEEVDISQLSLDERITHKNWKVRLEAYKELTRLFHLATSVKDEIFRDYWEAVKKAPLEANAATQEYALGLVVSFLKCSDLGVKSRGILVGPLAEKGLTANKLTARANTLEAIMLLIEADVAQPVIDELLQSLTNSSKQPKLIVAILGALKEIVKCFGCPTIPWKPIVKHLGDSYFGHADKNVRQEAMALLVEMHKWAKEAVLGHLERMRPVQLKEVQELCAQNTNTPTPTRWLASQRLAPGQIGALQPAEKASENAENASMEVDAPVVEVDEYDYAAAIDVLSKITEAFYEAMQSANWKERKDALDALLPELKVTRAQEGRYGELLQVLSRHVSTDANIMVVISAANCLEALGKALRSNISSFKTDCIIPALLERCKEKRGNVLEALRTALDAQSLGIQSLMDFFGCFAGFLAHKNPSVKAETLSWISRMLSKTEPAGKNKKLGKKEVKQLVDASITTMDDSTTEVRDAAAQLFASLITSHGEGIVLPFLSDKLDKIKLGKITALTGEKNEKAVISSESKKPPTTAPMISNVSKSQTQQQSTKSAPTKPAQVATSVSKTEPSFKYSENDAISAFSDDYPSVYDSLGDSNWKVRLETISGLSFDSSLPSELVVRMIAARPGWKESNIQVLGKALEVLQKYQGTISVEAASLLVSGLAERISETKLQRDIFELFSRCAFEVKNPHYIFSQLLNQIQILKSPKAVSEAVKYLQSLVLDYGTICVPQQALASEASFVKQLLSNSNPLVRGAAVDLASSLKGFHGSRVRDLLADLPAAILATLDGEFAKVSQLEPRKQVGGSSQKDNNTNNSGDKASPELMEEVDDSPRKDVSTVLTSILEKINDANWKVRKEALDELLAACKGEKISCSGSIQADLLGGLKLRVADSNKNLIIQALEISGVFCESLAKSALDKNLLRNALIPAACSCLADNKIQVRQAAILFLQKIIKLTPGAIGALREELKADSPNSKREILLLMTEIFNEGTNRPDLLEAADLTSAAIIQALQDRNGDVRKAAQGAIIAWASVVGSEGIIRVCQKTAVSQLSTVTALMSKDPKSATSANRLQSVIKTGGTSSAALGKKSTCGSSEIVGLLVESNKAQRTEHDKNLPLGFWTLEGAHEQQLKTLQEQFGESANAVVMSKLFSTDIKEQLSGMALLETLFEKSKGAAAEIISNLDLIIKYICVRLAECPLAFFNKALDVLEKLLGVLDEANQRLSEFEASMLIPAFVTKSASETNGREAARPRIRSIYRQMCRVYPASRIMGILLEQCKSKSSKVRCECLEEMLALVTRNGVSVLLAPNKQLPAISTLVADKDSQCRNGALSLLVQIHEIIGPEAFSKHVGDSLTGKEYDMFEERLKRYRENLTSQASGSSNQGSPPETPKKQNEPLIVPSSASKLEIVVTEPEPEPMHIDDEEQEAIPSLIPPPPINLFRRNGATPFEEHPLDHLIDLIGCTADLQCINAMQKIEEALGSKEAALQTRVEPLMHALTIRLKEACGSSLKLVEGDVDILVNKSRLSRYIANAMVMVVADAELSSILSNSPEVYSLIVEETLRALISERLQQFSDEDRELVQKSLNLLLVKSIEGVSANLAYK